MLVITSTVGGMLEQPVGHLLERQPNVLEADLLADDVERHGREAMVHGAHGARSTVPSPMPASNRRRAGGRGWMLASSMPDALGDHPLLAAGRDEQQVFLAVVVEAEVLAGAVAAVCGSRRTGRTPSAPFTAATPADRAAMKACTRSTVSVVTRPPSRRRLTSLPSFTASRPKVDSAMRARRQNSAMSRRSVSLNGDDLPDGLLPGSERRTVGASTTIVPTGKSGQAEWDNLSYLGGRPDRSVLSRARIPSAKPRARARCARRSACRQQTRCSVGWTGHSRLDRSVHAGTAISSSQCPPAHPVRIDAELVGAAGIRMRVASLDHADHPIGGAKQDAA